MKIFITGGSGLLGHKIAELALERGYDVYSGYNAHEPSVGIKIRYDLQIPSSVFDVVTKKKPDVIIHTAALTNVDKCEIEKSLAYKINTEGTKTISEVARKINAFLIYVSTDYVFDGNKGMYCENDSTNPVNHYGYTKLLGEQYCNDANIARTSVIYGAKPARGKVNFVLWLIQKLEDGESVKIVKDQYISPTFNTNLAKMLLEIAERKITGIFHLSGDTGLSRYDFALKVAEIFGLDKSLIQSARMSDMNWIAKRPVNTTLDTSKAKQILRERPYDVEKSLNILKKELGK